MRATLPARLAPLLLMLLAVPVAGCGGDAESGVDGDEREIRRVVRLSLTTDDPGPDCRERLSDRLIDRTYRTRERCVRVQEDDDDDDSSTKAVDFNRIEVDGDRATTDVELRGGDLDGAAGGLALVREDEDWRLDDISTALLRTVVERGLRSEDDEDVPAAVKRCFGNLADGLSDADFKRFAYGLIGEVEKSMRTVFEGLADCEGEGGRSALRELFEQGVVDGLEEADADSQTARCIVRTLRERVSDDELSEVLASQDEQALASEGAEAARACKMRSESLEPS